MREVMVHSTPHHPIPTSFPPLPPGCSLSHGVGFDIDVPYWAEHSIVTYSQHFGPLWDSGFSVDHWREKLLCPKLSAALTCVCKHGSSLTCPSSKSTVVGSPPPSPPFSFEARSYAAQTDTKLVMSPRLPFKLLILLPLHPKCWINGHPLPCPPDVKKFWQGAWTGGSLLVASKVARYIHIKVYMQNNIK